MLNTRYDVMNPFSVYKRKGIVRNLGKEELVIQGINVPVLFPIEVFGAAIQNRICKNNKLSFLRSKDRNFLFSFSEIRYTYIYEPVRTKVYTRHHDIQKYGLDDPKFHSYRKLSSGNESKVTIGKNLTIDNKKRRVAYHVKWRLFKAS